MMNFSSGGVVFQRIRDDDEDSKGKKPSSDPPRILDTSSTLRDSPPKRRNSSPPPSPPAERRSSTRTASQIRSSSRTGKSTSLNASKKKHKQKTSSKSKRSMPEQPPPREITSHNSINNKPRLSFLRKTTAAGSSSSRNKSPTKGSRKNIKNNTTLDFDMGGTSAEDDDPVMVLFQMRTKQRVRFSLEEGVQPKERGVGGSSGMTRQETGLPPSPQQESPRAAFNIKKFMKGALFGGTNSSINGNKQQGIKQAQSEEYEFELAKEVEEVKQQNNQVAWSTPDDEPEVLKKTQSRTSTAASADAVASYTEDRETRATVMKLLNKARRAQFLHYRYSYAVKCYVRALELLASYPDPHPTVQKTLKLLQNAHFCDTSFRNSANIVKLGIKYEDTGELVRALKMYTIAYRIRRDNLSATHPSLVVLLNMLGSIQVKRGELAEAHQIFQLALKDTGASSQHHPLSPTNSDDSTQSQPETTPTVNYLTRAVTYREMGTIHEQWSEIERAHHMYHASLECMADYKGIVFTKPAFVLDCGDGGGGEEKKMANEQRHGFTTVLQDLDEMRLDGGALLDLDDEGEEVPFLAAEPTAKSHNKHNNNNKKERYSNVLDPLIPPSRYDIFFPPELDALMKPAPRKKSHKRNSSSKESPPEPRGDHTDVEVALTIHRIAQLHRAQHEYQWALPAFYVSLRGMRYALGKSHPNVAAILGNIGNLLKEMGDMDAAYATYQQVLAIESYRLGLSHPDVVVTLHNIATIDAARGNLDHALSLYTQVVTLQRKLFGVDDESVAVTSACMGDVYERLWDYKSATESYEEALRIKIVALGRHALETARLLHKLGKLALAQGDYHLAESYLSKAALVYRLNKLSDVDEWVIDVNRDQADVEAAIAMGRGQVFEC